MRRSTLGSYIRSLRKQQHMTQAQLAKKVNVTDKAVSKWERDISYPDIALFPKLADILGVTVDDLLSECLDENQPSRLLQIFEMSHDLRTPLHIILGCTDMAGIYIEDKEQLTRYLDNIRISGEYLLKKIEHLMELTFQDPEMIWKDKREKGEKTEDAITDVNYKLEGPSQKAVISNKESLNNYDFNGKRILLAEDMALNREITAGILKQTGAIVDFASDGRKCLEMIKSSPSGYYDLILMDILMPDINGIEATRMIRQLSDPKKAAIPVIAMTASVYEKDRNEAFAAGMNAFTEKPIQTARLFETMNHFLNPEEES